MPLRFEGNSQQGNAKNDAVFHNLSIRSFGSISTFHDASEDSFGNYMGKARTMIAAGGKNNFLEWATKLKDLNDLKLNRMYFTTKLESAESHIF